MVSDEGGEITRTFPCRRCKTAEVSLTAEPSAFGPPFGEAFARMAAVCDSCAEIEGREEREREERERQQNKALRLRESGLPQAMWNLTLDGLTVDADNEKGIAAAKRWAAGEIKGLLLTGPVGTGKTVTAAAAMNAFLLRRSCRWSPLSRMAVAMRAGFKSERRDELMDLLLTPTMPIVIDDMDKSKPTDTLIDMLFQALDDRITAGTPLLVTTNLNYTETKEQYGEPIASRLVGYCEAVRMEGQDRRRT